MHDYDIPCPNLMLAVHSHDGMRIVEKVREFYATTSDHERLIQQLPVVMDNLRRYAADYPEGIRVALAVHDLLLPWRGDRTFDKYRRDLFLWLADHCPDFRFFIDDEPGHRFEPLTPR